MRSCGLRGSARALAGLSVAAALLGQSPLGAQAVRADAFALTVDSIMRGPDLVGYPPEGLRWSADSQNLYFE